MGVTIAISARCMKCRRDNKPTARLCKGCNAKLETKYVVRIKDSKLGKWRTKTVASLRQAREVEAKFKVQQIEGVFFDKVKSDDFSFERYLGHSELTKKSWKGDRNR